MGERVKERKGEGERERRGERACVFSLLSNEKSLSAINIDKKKKKQSKENATLQRRLADAIVYKGQITPVLLFFLLLSLASAVECEAMRLSTTSREPAS